MEIGSKMMRMALRKHSRGNSLVELVLLVPLYVLIIAGALLLGEIALVRIQSHEANEYAAYQPGDQSETAGLPDSGVMKAQFLRRYLGSLDLREIDEGSVPSASELEDLLEEMTREQYATVAHGSYSFSNGRLQYRITTSRNSWRSWQGDYVLANGLLEDNVPDLMHDTAVGYMDRNRVRTDFHFIPQYLTWSKFELKPDDAPEGYEIRTEHQAARRLDLLREVDRRYGAPNAPIEALTTRFGDGSGTMEHYPQFMDSGEFWEPE